MGHPIPVFGKRVYDELRDFCRAWVNSGNALTNEKIQEWKRANLKSPKQLILGLELGADPNVGVCPSCAGRGCSDCGNVGIVYLTDRRLISGPVTPPAEEP